MWVRPQIRSRQCVTTLKVRVRVRAQLRVNSDLIIGLHAELDGRFSSISHVVVTVRTVPQELELCAALQSEP